MAVSWNDKAFKDKMRKAGNDGIEEFALTCWLPQAKAACPVDGGTMRNSLGVERDDNNNCCYAGGGGASSSYILKQELDRSLRHPSGRAGFIGDTLQQNISKLPTYVKKHIG
ncbi:hypothetical protein M0R72_15730 [Candidatus Pacearchaeota archaeon]|nr:hypothetical protein [Candidatus Pacearchaeota archaeon]